MADAIAKERISLYIRDTCLCHVYAGRKSGFSVLRLAAARGGKALSSSASSIGVLSRFGAGNPNVRTAAFLKAVIDLAQLFEDDDEDEDENNGRYEIPLYSTVTLFARLRGLSTSQPNCTARW